MRVYIIIGTVSGGQERTCVSVCESMCVNGEGLAGELLDLNKTTHHEERRKERGETVREKKREENASECKKGGKSEVSPSPPFFVVLRERDRQQQQQGGKPNKETNVKRRGKQNKIHHQIRVTTKSKEVSRRESFRTPTKAGRTQRTDVAVKRRKKGETGKQTN